MKKQHIYLFLIFNCNLISFYTYSQSNTRIYEYDVNGNREVRKVPENSSNGRLAAEPILVQLDEKIHIYPNPSQGIYSVNLPQELVGFSELKIFNISGRLVFVEDITSSNIKVNLSNQPVGVYLFRIKTEEEVVIKKVLKE